MSHITQAEARDTIFYSIARSAEPDSTKIALCASLELSSCRAENCQLKQKLVECEATIQSLRQVVASIADKQMEILGEVVELRKESRAAPVTPPQISTLDTSTSTTQDGVPDWDGYMPDSDSDDWDSSHAPRTFSPFISPLATSESCSEPELDFTHQEADQDPILTSSWRRNQMLDRIVEEESEDEEDTQPLTPESPVSENWDDESDN